MSVDLDRIMFSNKVNKKEIGELSREDVEYLYANIPSLRQALNVVKRLIVDTDFEDDIDFKNDIDDITQELLMHGAVGIRKVSDGIKIVPRASIEVVYKERIDEPFVYDEVVYLLRRDELSASKRKRKFTKEKSVRDARFYIDEFGNVVSTSKDWLALSKDELVILRLNEQEKPPVAAELSRLQIVVQLMHMINKEIDRNGIGTIAVKYNESISRKLENESATTFAKIIDSNAQASNRREEVEKLSETLSDTEYNDVIVYSESFDNLEQLDRDFSTMDVIEFVFNEAKKLSADVYEIPYQMMDFESRGNIGKEEISKQFKISNIVPLRNLLSDELVKVFEMLGVKPTRMINSELSEYANYDNDIKILDVYARLNELGKMAEAEAFFSANFTN